MIYYIKSTSEWRPYKDPEVVLNTSSDCVIADSVDEAVDIINANFNEYGPDFIVAEIDKYRPYKKNDPDITILRNKTLRDMSFFEALEIIKNHKGELYISSYDLRSKWKNEISGKNFSDYGLLNFGLSFEYDLEKIIPSIPKKTIPRKNFIYSYDITSFLDGLRSEIRAAVFKHYSLNDDLLGIAVKNIYCYNDLKYERCNTILIYIKKFEKWFGKYSYRKTKSFQRFKEVWKKGKPKTAKSIGVPQKFFDFMQNEYQKRKPRNLEFKGRKTITNVKSSNV